MLRKEDILAVLKTLVDLRDGRGEIDDIDNLGNRRVRSVGELMENQYRIGLLRMERAIKERMSSVEIDTVMPQDLINAKPAAAAVREFFGSSQLSQFMDQTNPLSEITHKRRLSALGPGGLTRERAGFEVRDVHPTHYGRICPIETPEGPNIGLINSLATFARVNKYGFIESPYRRVKDGKVTEEVRLPVGDGGGEAHRRPGQRRARRQAASSPRTWSSAATPATSMLVPRDKVDFMDVSPKQLVSVAAALIPFLENDDANRALMGSNMQRQAVPLVTRRRAAGRHRHGGGRGARFRRRDRRPPHRRRRPDRRHPYRHPRDRGDRPDQVGRRHLPADEVPALEPEHLHQPASAGAGGRPGGEAATSSPTVRRPISAIWRSAATCSSRSCRGTATTSRTSILLSERIVRDDVFTSIHIEEFEVMARDTKLGPEEITRDIPNVSEEALKNLDEAGIVYIGAEVQPGDILVGKITPKGESPMTPEEKLLRAIFGEKASDVRDTSLRVPPGVHRHGRRGARLQPPRRRQGRARAWRSSARRSSASPRTATTSWRSSTATSTAACATLLMRQGASPGPRASRRAPRSREAMLDEHPRSPVVAVRARTTRRPMAEIEAMRKQYDEAKKRLEKRFVDKVEKLQRGDELPPGVMKMVKVFVAVKRKIQPGDKMAGRHGNKGVVSQDRADRGHAVPRGRHAGRHRAQSARRAEPHERRPDPRDPSRLGLRRPRPARSASCSRPIRRAATVEAAARTC